MIRKSFHYLQMLLKNMKTFYLRLERRESLGDENCWLYFFRASSSVSVAESIKSTTSCLFNSNELIKDIKIVPTVISREKQRFPYSFVNSSCNFFTLNVMMIPHRYPNTLMIPTDTSSHCISNVNSTASSCPTRLKPTMNIL